MGVAWNGIAYLFKTKLNHILIKVCFRNHKGITYSNLIILVFKIWTWRKILDLVFVKLSYNLTHQKKGFLSNDWFVEEFFLATGNSSIKISSKCYRFLLHLPCFCCETKHSNFNSGPGACLMFKAFGGWGAGGGGIFGIKLQNCHSPHISFISTILLCHLQMKDRKLFPIVHQTCDRRNRTTDQDKERTEMIELVNLNIIWTHVLYCALKWTFQTPIRSSLFKSHHNNLIIIALTAIFEAGIEAGACEHGGETSPISFLSLWSLTR